MFWSWLSDHMCCRLYGLQSLLCMRQRALFSLRKLKGKVSLNDEEIFTPVLSRTRGRAAKFSATHAKTQVRAKSFRQSFPQLNKIRSSELVELRKTLTEKTLTSLHSFKSRAENLVYAKIFDSRLSDMRFSGCNRGISLEYQNIFET